jgi:Tol biopolymer transport system component
VVDESWLDAKQTICKVSIDGGKPVQLTDYLSIAPSFSPDGKLISFLQPSNLLVQKGSLCVISSDGGEPINRFEVVSFDWRYVTPRWTPDGRALIYVEKEKNCSNLWQQPLSGGAPEQFTKFNTDYIFNFDFSQLVIL